MSVKFDDKSEQFMTKTEQSIDRVLGTAAIDIERMSKMQVPHASGRLQTSGHHEKTAPMHYVISYNTPYARRWEYETPKNGFKEGRKSRYLRDPAEQIGAKLVDRLKQQLGGSNV